jgi:hypothetical protein
MFISNIKFIRLKCKKINYLMEVEEGGVVERRRWRTMVERRWKRKRNMF